MTYVTEEILAFAQNLLVHIQLDAQVGHVLIDDGLVWSKASEPEGMNIGSTLTRFVGMKKKRKLTV